MKKLILIIPLLCCVLMVNGQTKKVKERDILGTWRLVIDLDAEDIEDELDEDDGFLARVMVQSVAGIVEGILDAIEIELEFRDDNEVRVLVDAFGATEIEYTDWHINRRGELVIGDTDSFHHDDDYWLFDGDILVAHDHHDDMEPRVYLVNID